MKSKRSNRVHHRLRGWRTRALTWGAALFMTSVASAATPLDEFRNASEFYVDNGVARYDGKDGNVEYLLFTKAAGSLNLSVPATSLGINHSGVISMTGSIHGDELWMDFDERLQNAGNIRRVEGRLVMRVMRVAGREALYCRGGVCPHGLRVVNDPETTWVRIHGTSGFIQWSRLMEVRFEGFAGNGRPIVDQLSFTAPNAICARSGRRTYTGRVRLAAAMPTDTYVEVSATDSAVLSLTHVRVPAGRTHAIFPFNVPSDYSGTVGVMASSSGVILREELRIPEQNVFCLAGGVTFEVIDIEAELMCRGCIDIGRIGLNGRVAAQVMGMTHRRDRFGQWSRLSDQAGFEASDLVMSELGDLSGQIANGSQAGQAFFLRSGDPVPEPISLSLPAGINSAGTVFGAAPTPSGLTAALWQDGLIQPMALPEGSTMIDGKAFGRGIGHRQQNGQTIPAVFSGGQSRDILSGPGTAVAVNTIGDVVGNSLQPSSSTAFLLPYHSRVPIFIASPHPSLRTQAIGLSDAGVAVVNLIGQDGLPAGAALYQEDGQFTTLSSALGALSTWVHVHEVIDVSTNLDLLVRGTLHGQPTTFALRAIVGGP